MKLRIVFLILLALCGRAVAQQVTVAVDPYREWATLQWGASVVGDPNKEATVWGQDADPDGDGYTNLQEYAFGTDPKTYSADPVTRESQSPEPGYAAVTFRQRADDAALLVYPQYSDDLDLWLPFSPQDSFTYNGHDTMFFKYAESAAVNGFKTLTYLSALPAGAAPGESTPALFTRLNVMRSSSQAIGTPFDALNFFDSISGIEGGTVESNAVVLTGFVGSARLTVAGGAHLIVNGVDVGTSALVPVGSAVRLRATSTFGGKPGGGMTKHTLSIGNVAKTWTVETRPIAATAGISGTPSGYTPVSVSVGGGGDANISLPITVPPGTGGMEPKLAITYSSQGGDGILGMGFNFSGLSAITRTGPVQYLDGIKGGVTFGPNDRFLLDGQRLILYSGKWGTDGSEYRTEQDTFSKITYHALGAGASYWEVKTKAGLTYDYGTSADSRILANRASVPGDTAILCWAVTAVTDTNGSRYRCIYNGADATDGGYPRPAGIVYTENLAQNLQPAEEVDFYYQSRPDVRTSYVGGAKVVMSKRLSSIDCKQAGNIARHYDFTYQQAEISNNSQLTSVVERGKKPESSSNAWETFPATTFAWDHKPAGTPKMTATTPATDPTLATLGFSKSPPSIIVQGDFNGDGRMDVMQFDDHANVWIAFGNADGTLSKVTATSSSANGFSGDDYSGNTTYSRIVTGDFNGDGKTDVLQMNRDGSTNYVALSNGDGSFNVIRGSALGALQGVGQTGDYQTDVFALDLDGDGRTDIVLLSRNTFNRVFLSNGDGSFREKVLLAGDPFRDNFVIAPDSDGTNTYLVPGDFNGDGLGDILLLYADGSANKLALSKGDGTFTVLTGSQLGSMASFPFRRTRATFVAGDFNGDGLTDLAHFDNTDGDGNPNRIALSKGDGSFETIVEPPALQNLPLNVPGGSYLLAGDFTGNGFSDIFNAYYPTSASGWLVFSTGDTNFLQGDPNVYADLLNDQTYDAFDDSRQRARLFTGDFDGDGTDDILYLYQEADVSYHTRSNGFNADRVVQVTNGHGGYTKITYQPLTNPGMYTKGTAAVYPYTDVIGAMYVVATLVSRNGVDGDAFTVQANPANGESTMFYHYFGATALLDGHGFQGFAAIQAASVETGITLRTEYVMSDPNLAGRCSRELRTLSNAIISDTQTTWTSNAITLPSGAHSYFPYATHTLALEYEIHDGLGAPPVKTTTISGQTYDGYGNLTHSLTDYGGGFTEETTSSYTNDTTNWWLGRLSSTVVTQTSPGPVSASRHSTFAYSPSNGQLIEETIVTSPTALGLQKTYVHDAFGNIKQSTLKDLGTGATRTTKTTYNADGRFISTTMNALGQVERKTYDPLNGTVTSQTGPNGLTTTWTYDGFGRPLTASRADATQTVTQYLRCAPGDGVPPRAVHCVRSQSSGSGPSTVYFDVLDRQIRQDATGFDGSTVSVHSVYDTKGEVTKTSIPFFSSASVVTAPTSQYTTNYYDRISRVIQQDVPGATTGNSVDMAARTTSTVYSGLTATVTNPKGETFKTTVDLRGRTSASTSFGTDTVANTYNPYGNPTKVDDGHGHVTTMTYDARGNKTSMSEPNSGTTTYNYNAFGELVWQQDALNRVTTLAYDALGRMIRRTEQDTAGGVPIETDWVYDKLASGKPNPNGVGKLSFVTRPSDGYLESYTYDPLGRLSSTRTQVGSMVFVSSTIFDQYSRPHTLVYPSSFAVQYVYNENGHLAQVVDAGPSSLVYWQATNVNARGQIVQEKFGNGLFTHRDFDANTGLLSGIETGSNGGTGVNPTVQGLAYFYDNLNNLTQRRDRERGIIESFTYDETNQLAQITCSAADTVNIVCGQMGNILSRSDVGSYHYDGPRPHAVTSITADGKVARTLTYNAVGNCTQDGATKLTYNAANQPLSIFGQDGSFAFSYTPSRARLTRTELVNGTTTNRVYVGSLYERDDNGATVAKIHFIPAGGGVVAIHTETVAKNTPMVTTTRYVHKDHLGSVQALTDESGKPVETLDYDAWGRRRTFDATTGRFSYGAVTSQTDRGFTGHEMLDAVGLIHMNGRIYDPTIGRFLSVDPVVQEAGNLQNLNRYCYVLNNPLSLTDPSGFSFWRKALGFLLQGPIALTGWGRQHAQLINQIEWAVVAIAITPFVGPVAAGAISGFGSAFTGTLLAGGSVGDAARAGLNGGLWGAAEAAGAYGVGQVFDGSPLKPLIHGVVQGEISSAEGGKFSHGFYSAFAASVFEPAANYARDDLDGGVWAGRAVAAVAGGTASELGGGKFANGAVTGAFIQAFNSDYHRGGDPAEQTRDALESTSKAFGYLGLFDHVFGTTLAEIPIVHSLSLTVDGILALDHPSIDSFSNLVPIVGEWKGDVELGGDLLYTAAHSVFPESSEAAVLGFADTAAGRAVETGASWLQSSQPFGSSRVPTIQACSRTTGYCSPPTPIYP